MLVHLASANHVSGDDANPSSVAMLVRFMHLVLVSRTSLHFLVLYATFGLQNLEMEWPACRTQRYIISERM